MRPITIRCPTAIARDAEVLLSDGQDLVKLVSIFKIDIAIEPNGIVVAKLYVPANLLVLADAVLEEAPAPINEPESDEPA
jgi:hypothetical protein